MEYRRLVRNSTRPGRPWRFSSVSSLRTTVSRKSSPPRRGAFDSPAQRAVGVGVDVAEGEVFKLAAQLAHAEPVRERGVDVQGFAGDAFLLVGPQRAERAHVVQAVGHLDEHDADVRDHGQQHLADVFGLVVFLVGELDLVELGDAFDDVRDLLAEAPGDLGRGHVGVFDRVVQQAGGDGGGVHLHLGEDLADFQRMNDVRLARRALLALVLLHAELPGVAHDVEVVRGAVGVQGAEEVLELLVDDADLFAGAVGEVAGGGDGVGWGGGGCDGGEEAGGSVEAVGVGCGRSCGRRTESCGCMGAGGGTAASRLRPESEVGMSAASDAADGTSVPSGGMFYFSSGIGAGPCGGVGAGARSGMSLPGVEVVAGSEAGLTTAG